MVSAMFDSLGRNSNSMRERATTISRTGIAIPLMGANSADMYQGCVGPVPANLNSVNNLGNDGGDQGDLQGRSRCPASPGIPRDARQ